MMDKWRSKLKYDPIPTLLAAGDPAIRYFAERDLLGKTVDSITSLWELPQVKQILKKQSADGSWPVKRSVKPNAVNYHLVETWRWSRHLIQQYGMTREHPALEKAAEYLFSCQTGDGDFRGFLANQYATYYSGVITGLLVDAGYADDPRIEKGIHWLLDMRQDDHGWTIPILTHKLDRCTLYRLTSEFAEPLQPDRSKPFSHNWTGMVLRAFATHPHYRKSNEARIAAKLLSSRFFKVDSYSSYHSADHWLIFDFPFWWNHLVSALDTISLISDTPFDENVSMAIQWLIEHQQTNGFWMLNNAKPDKPESRSKLELERKQWVTLAICRILKRIPV